MQPPEGPPVWTALNGLSLRTPPPMSKIIWRSVMPNGTSTRPVRLTFPTRANVLVPLLFSVPYWANHSAPFGRICETQARVSTLLMMVGLPQRPETPRPFLDLHVKVELRAQDPVAQQPVLFRLTERHAQSLQRERILSPAID